MATLAAFGYIVSGDFIQDIVFLLTVPISILLLVSLLVCACFPRYKDCLWAAGAIATFLGVGAGLIASQRSDPQCIRSTVRWAFTSRDYKKRVLNQRQSMPGELKHVIWDASGFVPAGFTFIYLVNDPTDSLNAAASSGEIGDVPGVPCTVDRVHKLEPQWYTVLLPTDYGWDDCHHAGDNGLTSPSKKTLEDAMLDASQISAPPVSFNLQKTGVNTVLFHSARAVVSSSSLPTS